MYPGRPAMLNYLALLVLLLLLPPSEAYALLTPLTTKSWVLQRPKPPSIKGFPTFAQTSPSPSSPSKSSPSAPRKAIVIVRRARDLPGNDEEMSKLQLQLQEIEASLEAKQQQAKKLQDEIYKLQEKRRGIQLQVNTQFPPVGSVLNVIETPLRSVVKACTWRFVAALITLSTSFFFSGSVKVAASIVGSDFLSKAGTMYIGERVWNKVNWGKSKSGDSAQRSVIKALAWRLFAAANTLVLSLLFAKNMKTAGKIASADTVIKTTLYVVHERAWSQVEWGRTYEVEYNI